MSNDIIEDKQVEPSPETQAQIDAGRSDEDLRQAADELTDTTDAIVSLDAVAQRMEESEQGFQTAGGQAVAVAVEGLLSRVKMKANICFEEYSTQRKRLSQHQIAIEGIRDVLSKLWEKIKEIVMRIINWFKGLFDRRNARVASLKAKMDTLGDKIEQKKSSPKKEEPVVASDIDHNFINSTHLFRFISINGVVPEYEKFMSLYAEHTKQVETLYLHLGAQIDKVIAGANGAMKTVYKKGQGFSDYVDSTYSNAYGLPFQMPKSRDQERFGQLSPGVTVYEMPLVFGEKAFFRTGLYDSKHIYPKDLHCGVMSKTGAHPYPTNARVRKLTQDEVGRLHDVAKDHYNHFIKKQQDRYHEVKQNLEEIEHSLKSIQSRKDTESDRILTGRCRRINDIIVTVSRLLPACDSALFQYDLDVYDAALSWGIHSF